MEALRNRSVPHAQIARITGVSTETIRQMRIAAGIPGDGKKVRGKVPGLICFSAIRFGLRKTERPIS